MKETSNSGTILRFAVTFTVVDLISNEEHKTVLGYFDEFSDACLWIREHGSMFASESDCKGIGRYFRIEKRYYL